MTRLTLGVGVILLSACSSAPTTYGPSVMVLPGTGKTFDNFRADEQECRAHAQSEIAKSSTEQDSAGSPQQRYDRFFLQCMYAKGHKVPLTGRVSDYVDSSAPRSSSTPASSSTRGAPPPPPAGQPPAEVPPDLRPAK